MQTIQKRRNRATRLITPAIAAAVLAYFAIQANSGQYGIDSRERLSRELDIRRADLAELERRRASLRQQVQLLHDNTLERDMIDERARRALNYVRENELVIMK